LQRVVDGIRQMSGSHAMLVVPCLGFYTGRRFDWAMR
jgi:hypothetical protein